MKEIKTSEEARNYFDKKGLNYCDINLTQYLALREFIAEELKVHEGLSMKLSRKKLKYEPNIDVLGLNYAFIVVDGTYFKEREAISFNSDGFIGFAGWSDSNNVQPFVKAFVKWVDSLYKKGSVSKETLKSLRDETIRDIGVQRIIIPKRYINKLTKEEIIHIIYGRMQKTKTHLKEVQ